MTKIGICGDVHISEKSPRARRDDYLETVLEKLDFIAKENDKVIILGDLFHSSANSDFLFNKMFSFFNKHKGKFISIIGNHDIFHNNLNSLDRTTIGSLYITGVLDLKWKDFEIDKVKFAVSLPQVNIDNILVDETNESILLGHNFYSIELSPKENLTKEDIRKLNYNLVFLGHDHKPYEDEFVGNSIVVRMGSLTRIDTQLYNKDREIVYCQYDTKTRLYDRKVVPHKKVEEVYIPEAFNKVGKRKDFMSFTDIGKILAGFKKCAEGSHSLDKTLDKVGATRRDKEIIKSLHEVSGITYF